MKSAPCPDSGTGNRSRGKTSQVPNSLDIQDADKQDHENVGINDTEVQDLDIEEPEDMMTLDQFQCSLKWETHARQTLNIGATSSKKDRLSGKMFEFSHDGGFN